MRVSKPIGIDLGTTNSCVCLTNSREDAIVMPKDGAGGFTTPSCVWHDAVSNEIVVGAKAFRRRGSRPEPVVSIKRKMGTALLTPLGKATLLPVNLPPLLRQVLGETREERLERHLRRFVQESGAGQSPASITAEVARLRLKPPPMWVFDQAARLRAYLDGLTDPAQRQQEAADPPLLWLPEEISALILAEMKRLISATLAAQDGGIAHEVEKAVVTVPAYFGTGQIEATKEAGRLAGMNVLELLHEPTAAAIYYCWKNRLPDGNFMIYDLGGGTFDVSIVRCRHGRFDVIGISGDNLLGGDNMDNALANWIRMQVAKPELRHDLELDLSNVRDRCIRNRFVMLAESVKKQLGNKDEVQIADDTTVKDRQARSVSIRLSLTRRLFDDLNRGIVEQSIIKCYEALAKAGRKAEVSLKDIDRIFLVGGSTRVALVREVVLENFCQGGGRIFSPAEQAALVEQIKGDDSGDTEILRQLAAGMLAAGERAKCDAPLLDDPDLCVAKGAGVKAAGFGTESRDDASGLGLTLIGLGPTNEPETVVKGILTAEPDTDLAGVRVCLTDVARNTEREVVIGADPGFVFKAVPLQARTRNEFRLTVFSAAGAVLCQRTIHIEQNPELEIGTVESPGVTLSKAILVDVKRRGQLQKQVLVTSGRSLPVTEEHQLKVPNPNVGMVDFRIYQDRKHLKTITAVIDPTLPAGTPITLTFTIEEDHFMRCGYQIGRDDMPQWAIIEPPAPDAVPTREEIERLCERIEEAVSVKDKVDQRIHLNQLARLKRGIQEARDAADDPKLIALGHELRDLHATVVEGPALLTPPWEVIDQLVSRCRALTAKLAAQKPDFPAEETQKNLDEQRRSAEGAFKRGEQEAYTAAQEQLKATLRGLDSSLTPEPGQEITDEDRRRWLRESAEAGANNAKILRQQAADFAQKFQTNAAAAATEDARRLNQQQEQQCRTIADSLDRCATALEQLLHDPMDDIGASLRKGSAILNDVQRHQAVLQAKKGVLDGGLGERPHVVPESLTS